MEDDGDEEAATKVSCGAKGKPVKSPWDSHLRYIYWFIWLHWHVVWPENMQLTTGSTMFTSYCAHIYSIPCVPACTCVYLCVPLCTWHHVYTFLWCLGSREFFYPFCFLSKLAAKLYLTEHDWDDLVKGQLLPKKISIWPWHRCFQTLMSRSNKYRKYIPQQQNSHVLIIFSCAPLQTFWQCVCSVWLKTFDELTKKRRILHFCVLDGFFHDSNCV